MSELPIPSPSTGNGHPEPPAQTQAAAPLPVPQHVYASIFPGPLSPLPDRFADGVRKLEKALDLSLVLFLQRDGASHFDSVSEELKDSFLHSLAELPKSRPVGVLVHSLGGLAKPAFQMARLLQKHCGGFTAVIPRQAKSAATLLSLGADRILMHPYAELGPIDAQVFDADRESFASALDEVTALERLHAQSLTLLDSTMSLLSSRSGKRLDSLLPHALGFIAQTTRPLYEKIDAVHFASMSRILNVAEKYAKTLLRKNYSAEDADHIAFHLVYGYPDHGFVIDAQEASEFGLKLEEMNESQSKATDAVVPFLNKITAIGVMKGKEVQGDA